MLKLHQSTRMWKNPRSFRNDSKVTCLNGESLGRFSSATPKNSFQDNPVLNLSSQKFPSLPGIYMILCTANDWRYYGETSSLRDRRSSHKSLLKRGIHPNNPLQKDFNTFGEENFQFVVLYLGKHWEERHERCRREEQLVLHDVDRTYNIYKENSPKEHLNPFYSRFHSEETRKEMSERKKGIPNDALGRSVHVPSFTTRKNRAVIGGTFPSVAEASRQTGLSRHLIRDRVNSPDYPDWFEVETLSPSEKG